MYRSKRDKLVKDSTDAERWIEFMQGKRMNTSGHKIMRKLVYYKEGRQYYWLETSSSNKCLFSVISKQDFVKYKSKLSPLEKQVYPYEIIVFLTFAAFTFGIILTAR